MLRKQVMSLLIIGIFRVKEATYHVADQIRWRYFKKTEYDWTANQTGIAKSPEGYALKTLAM